MSCPALDVNGNACRNKGPFCKFHTYMKDYTPEMIANSTLCTGCKKMKYLTQKTCEECRTRVKPKKEIVLCAKQDCTFKKSEMNKYCGKHQLCHFIDETTQLGLKCCANAIRGCRNQLPITAYNRCEPCLQVEREKDHIKRGGHIVKTETEKQCSVCCKVKPMESFQGKLGETKTCLVCRKTNQRADEKREKQHVRELANQNAKKPERKEVKQAWKEANYEKVAGYWIEARARLIECNLEGFLKRNAEQAKHWRDANPEKVKLINQQKNDNIDYHFVNYKRSAETKHLEFTLTQENFMDIVILPCYYCGIIQPKGFNGLDRLLSMDGYTVNNVVSCCEMCNMMKKCSTPTIFVNRVTHISVYNKKIEGQFYPECFADTKNVYYNDYKVKSESRKIEFLITKEYFDKKIKQQCYLCGKFPTITHKNGLDRVDSLLGYIESNLQTCCSNCNYMKSNYSLELFLHKCESISKYYLSKYRDIEPIQEIRQIVKGNKLTPEEKKEKDKCRKQAQRDALRKKYGDEEYKKLHAKKIAEQRKKKNVEN
jgi:hypothetical protein